MEESIPEAYIPTLQDLVSDLDNNRLPADVKAFQYFKDDKDRSENKRSWIHLDELTSLATLNKVSNIFTGRQPPARRTHTS